MAKRGRPAKDKSVEKSTESTEVTETKKAMGEDTTLDLDSGIRDALYEKYQEGYVAEKTDTSAEEEVTEEETEETLSEEKSEEETETSAEKEVAVEEEVTETEAKEDKTVPLSALHEEREKRKSLSVKVSELENQLHEVLQDYRTRFDTEKVTAEAEEGEPDPVAVMTKRMEALEKRLKVGDERTVRADIDKKKQILDSQITNTDKGLEEEGYPGFLFAINAVTAELHKRVANDPENAYLDKPEGWAKIYKETVFPTLKAKFMKKDKEEIFDKKKDLKKDVKLTGGGKKPETAEKKEEEWTYDNYLQMRYDKQL